MNFNELFQYKDLDMFYCDIDSERERERGILINEDCTKVMRSLDDNIIDCVITDPPYNISRPNNFTTMGNKSRIGMEEGGGGG